MALKPFEWKDKPALIERNFPASMVSAESFKEQSAVQSKTLTALGSYWKGRKPLVLNKACVLASLLPATDNPLGDLETFELLMGMDRESMRLRIAARLPARRASEAEDFVVEHPFREQVGAAVRAEEMDEEVLYGHVWKKVNAYLGTDAKSFPELVQQMGEARFGRRPKIADVFSGSGQIPFEAARLGCDVYASDLNPVACMLTWGDFNVVGASPEQRKSIARAQKKLAESVGKQIDELGIEDGGDGWKAKAYLYCMEVKCPDGWTVPVLPTLIVSASKLLVVKLERNEENRRFGFSVHQCMNKEEMDRLSAGTLQDGYLVYEGDEGVLQRVSMKTIRGDFKAGGESRNTLRQWEKEDFVPREDDVFQERLYCIQWARPREGSGGRHDYKFSAPTEADLEREKKVEDFVRERIAGWQEKGFIPDMVIERGEKTDEPIRTRGWTHWHHLFCARQLLMLGLIKQEIRKAPAHREALELFFTRMLDWSTKLCYYGTGASRESIAHTFYNQALNTFYNYGVRPFSYAIQYLLEDAFSVPVTSDFSVRSHPADSIDEDCDIFITDPPYGDAVKYEEITEFFIAWLRKNPPEGFAGWTWDSRRTLAIKGEDETFRLGMIKSYATMQKHMPDNGIQILMFTHKSGSIWADMANIIWASGLRVAAAWCVTTETDAAIRQGANIKSTVVLVLRKRLGREQAFRSDLGEEIADAVQEQVEVLTGLNQKIREQRSEGIYTDADLQMAGYAAALKVLTSYSIIDGNDMETGAAGSEGSEARQKVLELISFAEQTAVQYLIPLGLEGGDWRCLRPMERFYLKMAELEARGEKSLDNYQRFSKAFNVKKYEDAIGHLKANATRLKLSSDFKDMFMSGDSEFAGTLLRVILHATWLLRENSNADAEDAIVRLMEDCPNYHMNRNMLSRITRVLAGYRGSPEMKKTGAYDPQAEAQALRILADAIEEQKV